jgi:hypothetical protein
VAAGASVVGAPPPTGALLVVVATAVAVLASGDVLLLSQLLAPSRMGAAQATTTPVIHRFIFTAMPSQVSFEPAGA